MVTVLKLRELRIGITFIPQSFFQPINIRIINIKDGYYYHSDYFESNKSLNSFIGFSNNSSFYFRTLNIKELIPLFK